MGSMKQMIIVRRDLNLPAGKAVAQGAHAALWAYQRTLKKGDGDAVARWTSQGCTKIVLGVDSEEELLALVETFDAAGIDRYVLVRDAGRTVLEPGTLTCLGIGPISAESVDPVTGHLKRY